MLEQVTLHNFCGFREFTVDAEQFSLLIGPNNGGKTTVLRAIKFCLDACRRVYLPNGQPRPERFKESNPHDALQNVANAGGFTDVDAVYFGRDRTDSAIVSLRFGGEPTLILRVECAASSNDVRPSIQFDGQLQQNLKDDAVREVFRRLASLHSDFIPPPATITPVEKVMTWGEVERDVALGKFAETWRNRLHWMYEGEEPDAFQRVVNRVRNYLGNVAIRPPKRGRNQPQVEIIYVEDGVEHDIAAAGGGLRTILTLAAAVELSQAPILLFDEPDSHLHSSIQRQVAGFLQESAALNKQILVTSHAPDFIEETPVDSIVWIDRANSLGQQCDEIGKALIDLGAVSHTQALATIGADALVYVEANPDRRAFSAILRKCAKGGLLDRIRLETLKGCGDASKLPGALEVIRKLRNLRLSITVLLDADYTQLSPTGNYEIKKGVLEIRLPGKELENLLLLSPQAIHLAVEREAERRRQFVANEVTIPSEHEIRQRISHFSRADELREIVEDQWVFRWAAVEGITLNDAGRLKKARGEFLTRWDDDEWRIRCCPGKETLRRLRQWLQAEYAISLSTSFLFECYEPTDEIRRLMDALEAHILSSPQ